ncbi:4-hydroxythreonine-4-phosphate dehydrogenase [Tranquillimonas rosea]|uniref:4-hydroxythreonine-4-phosphate dehydrogenase n=1 Tax=Tranquillimonas rosea TaxID=641238 RepID=A0A1H9WV69_9RHOB|nr:4-hydroxythreonine-4-phosphate dehydrogenase PdxA [Tranquillimonas rosea]SES37725.1 4-hydroxythreonine-4-phosphate dehydrogenase [Tranquillimonas rosea]
MTDRTEELPTLAVAMGDPGGISPELTARLVDLPEARDEARLVVIGDRRVFDEGARIAGIAPELPTVGDMETALATDGNVFVDLGHLDPATVTRGTAEKAGGDFACRNFREALLLAHAGKVDGICFTPFNKQAMRYSFPGYDDEIRFVADVTGFNGKIREFNVLEKIWNARVTSHVPLKEVSDNLSEDKILAEVDLTVRCLRRAGIDRPRIAVAGLNPHAGDGGSFGTEEIEIIEPAVARAKERAETEDFEIEGPYPSDTVFLRALKEDYHAVLTMYHDQGQIAMKMMGFDKGVTMMGGLPYPLCTPAHGTAYDIAGKGIADVGATREALRLAIRMARTARQAA